MDFRKFLNLEEFLRKHTKAIRFLFYERQWFSINFHIQNFKRYNFGTAAIICCF